MKPTAIIAAIILPTAAAAMQPSDTVPAHRPHELNEVEVLGVKQMPEPGNSPVTRITPAEIRRLGIDAVKDLSDIVPNLYSPDYGSRMTSSIYLRGLGSRIDQAVVGLSIDGVPFLNKDAYDFDLPDIASLSVLRGAQSVLNGRNAMAGQINVYTVSPRDFQGLRAMVEYGRANSLKTAVAGYFDLGREWYTSLSAYYHHTDGFFRNSYNDSRVGLENSGSLRWKTVWAPSRALSVTNTAAMSVSRQSGYPYESLRTGAIAYNDTCYYRRNAFSDGLTVAWAGRRVVVTSLTSVQYLDDNMTLDQDFTPADYFTLTQARHEWTVTEDLFTKGTRGAYSWLGGVFGFWRRGEMRAPVTFYDTGIRSLIENHRNDANPNYPVSWDDREFLLASNFTTPGGGFALYHESRYNLGDWSFEAGLRWDIERISCRYLSAADASYTTWHVLPDGQREFYMNTPVKIDDNGRLHQTFNELLPKLSVARRLPFGSVYATWTKGYKSGGINTQMFSDVLQQRVMETMGMSMAYDVADIVTYRPETSWNYEIGLKTSWLDGRLTADLTGFFIDCHDQQLTMFPPGLVTGRIMTNAGRTHSRGVELTARCEATSDLTLSASYGYTRATFRRYDNGREDNKGKRLPYVPAHTLFAQAVWRIPSLVAGARPVVGVNLRGTGDIMWNEANTVSQPFYALLGANAALEADTWSIRLWAENLTSTRYSTFYFLSIGNEFVQRGRPLVWGVTLRMNVGR
ncbi:MAG: TonB-dependent receptor [Bacteroidales bacterium]|nr:TonB-dependent receptor [Bacteroidales bacterium]